jgi:phage gp36-like protein
MYFTRSALETLIPPAFIVEALDDNGDGAEDTGLYDEIAAAAVSACDAYLIRRYTLPIAPVPPIVAEAAKIFAAEMLYQRRGIHGDQNPFTARANAQRTTLEHLATGAITLGATAPTAAAPIAIISESAGTVPASRLNG